MVEDGEEETIEDGFCEQEMRGRQGRRCEINCPGDTCVSLEVAFE